MFKAQGKVGHPANTDKIVAVRRRKHLRAFFDLSNAEYRELWLIDNWRSEQATKDTWIRDSERAPGYFVRLQLLVRARQLNRLRPGQT